MGSDCLEVWSVVVIVRLVGVVSYSSGDGERSVYIEETDGVLDGTL